MLAGRRKIASNLSGLYRNLHAATNLAPEPEGFPAWEIPVNTRNETGRNAYWNIIPRWSTVGESTFLSYKWQVYISASLH
jgi:hypothetical protein